MCDNQSVHSMTLQALGRDASEGLLISAYHTPKNNRIPPEHSIDAQLTPF